MLVLEGKVALVTGRASGIGLACVKEFLRNGVKGVAIADIKKEEGLKVLVEIGKKFGEDKVLFLNIDVTGKVQFEDAFKKTIEKFSNIDILVNNAGIFDEQNWEKMVAVNMNANITDSEALIVNMCSIASFNMRRFRLIYTATKPAPLGLSRSFGVDAHYERTKVKVITICHGLTQTTNPFEDYVIDEHYAKIFSGLKSSSIYQSPAHVASEVLELIKTAKTGSVWVIKNYQKSYELEFPSREDLCKKD